MKTAVNIMLAFIAGMALMGLLNETSNRNLELRNKMLEAKLHIRSLQDSLQDDNSRERCLRNVLYDVAGEFSNTRKYIRQHPHFVQFEEFCNGDVEDLNIVYENDKIQLQ